MKSFLITRPTHDPGLHVLHAWSEHVIAEAYERGWRISKADDVHANKKEVQSRLANRPDFVMFNGHGSDELIQGHNNETLVDLASSNLLSGTIVYARACKCLNRLGKEAVTNGCHAFIGYKGKLTIWRINEDLARPLQDPAVEPALTAANQIPISIIKGNPVSLSVERSKKVAEKRMLELLQSKEPHSVPALKSLISHYFLLGFEGRPEARVE